MKMYIWVRNLLFVSLFAFLAAQIGNRAVLSRSYAAQIPGMPASTQVSETREWEIEKDLSDYEVIWGRNMFNSNHGGGQPERPDRKDSETRAKAEGLNVTLIGTVVGPLEATYALIRDNHTGKQELLQVGEMIQGAAQIVSVSRCEVLVLRDGIEEVLECPKEAGRAEYVAVHGVGKLASLSSTGQAENTYEIREVSEGSFLVGREQVERALENTHELMMQIRAVPNRKDGATNGFRIFAMKPDSIFAAMGLKNGDVIQRINELDLSAPDNALRAYSALRNEEEFNLDILRGGHARSLRYEIR